MPLPYRQSKEPIIITTPAVLLATSSLLAAALIVIFAMFYCALAWRSVNLPNAQRKHALELLEGLRDLISIILKR